MKLQGDFSFFPPGFHCPEAFRGWKPNRLVSQWEALDHGQTQPNDINGDNLSLLQICFSEHTQIPKMFVFSRLPDIRFVKSQTVTEKQTQSRFPIDSYLGTLVFFRIASRKGFQNRFWTFYGSKSFKIIRFSSIHSKSIIQKNPEKGNQVQSCLNLAKWGSLSSKWLNRNTWNALK